MSNIRTAVGRKMAGKQSDKEPPVQQFVSVAVLPPRLPQGMAPTGGTAPSGAAYGFDESINWESNEPIETGEPSKSTKFFRKVGLTTQRMRKNPDLPPFMFRQVTYETWRKHYAKDADGNYHGTHAPAHDCLLKPDDVKRWRFEGDEAVVKGDRWTRGTEALPVYAEVGEQDRVPEYNSDDEYSGVLSGIPGGEPTVPRDAPVATPSLSESHTSSELHAPSGSHRPSEPQHRPSDAGPRRVVADGRTAQEIIEDAKAKAKAQKEAKGSWKKTFKRGIENSLMSIGN